jgi:hypothetical protein
MLSACRRNLSQRCATSLLNIVQGQNHINCTSTVAPMYHYNSTTVKKPYQRVFLSTYGGAPMGPLRSQPQYTIFGEKTMLSLKMIPPTFRCLKNGSLVLDQNKKGRILLEWSPRSDSGKYLIF